MEGEVLVAAHLSSLYTSSKASYITLNTKQDGAPLAEATDSERPLEHASHSEIFSSPETGPILLRLIHSGLIVELVPLSYDVSPVRIVYPAAVLPYPSIVVWESQELHIIAATAIGSIFRVVLPLRNDVTMWQNFSLPGRTWYREYIISKLKGNAKDILVQVQGTHSISIGMSEGSLLRIEVRRMGTDNEDDQWEESIFHHGSFLNSLTSLLHSGVPGGSDIISMASLQQPTDIGYVWTLSRDRTLRLWTPGGCASAKILSSGPTGKAISSASGSTPSAAKPSVLLPETPQRFLRVFASSTPDCPLTAVFIPTETSPTSAGSFYTFSTVGAQLQPGDLIECSPDSAHCHLQDFLVVADVLYCLWDSQGRSVVQKTHIYLAEGTPRQWQAAEYPEESELTPAYLDELLLLPGSLSDRFFEAIMRPGIFSPLTLQTALAQYVDAHLSLPGTTSMRPHQLLTTYASIGEGIAAVVGCTVSLSRDPQTGSQQYDRYWNALKRDWEGFIARCREIERSARWPLAIGIGDPGGEILILERERIGSVVVEDLPLRLHRSLSHNYNVEPQFALLEILWTLRSKLGQRTMLSLESRLTDIVHQEIAFPFADIIQDQANRLSIKEELDEGLDSWIAGRLQSITDIETAARGVLDVIGGFDKIVKKEEDEVMLLLPPVTLEWKRALIASYATSSTHSRYDLALSLVTLLFYLSEDLPLWDSSLLAEIFVVFRGVAMLRYTSRQPAGDKVVTDIGTDDDMVEKMRNMNVSAQHPQHTTCSLFQRLLFQIGSPIAAIPSAAHHFLDNTGLLQSLSPAHATRFEVEFCERLRGLSYREVAREALAWLPRTPGVSYVLSRLWLDECRYEDAASALEGLAGSFGVESGLSDEDREALGAVLPGAALFDSDFSFYLHAASLFKAATVAAHEVFFSQLALSVCPPGVNSSSLWYGITKGLTDLGFYDDAYAALTSCPYEKLKRECVGPLVYRMCEEHAVDQLMTFNFMGLADEVEESLSFKARNADPRVRPFYSRILYTWYISRGDYCDAASIMYQRARKLGTLTGAPAELIDITELQLEAYSVSINALSLVDSKSAWIVIPISSERSHGPRKRRKLSKNIPEDKYGLGKRDAEIVALADIQYEYTLLSAQKELIQLDSRFLSTELLSSPASIALNLAQFNRFNTAMAIARALNSDMRDIFARLVKQCLKLSHNPDAIIGEDTFDWLLTDKVSSWSGTSADRAWRYLRQSLERHDSVQTDYMYSKVVYETILATDRSTPPPWLVHILEDHHPEYLIRTCLRYDVLESALEHALALMRKSDLQLVQDKPKTPASTWLPYALIDQVLVAAEAMDDPSSQRQLYRKELRTEITNRLRRVHKLSQL